MAVQYNPDGSKTLIITRREAEGLVSHLLKRIRKKNGCWYGPARVKVDGMKVLVRRLFYVIFKNDPPLDSYQIGTSCPNRYRCINPDHLCRENRIGRSCQTGYDYNQILVEGG